jgi:MATE family multidrug resistance protein
MSDDEIVIIPKDSESSSAEEIISQRNPPEVVRSYREHLKDVLSLTGPIVMSEIFQNTLPVIDIAFVGNLPDKNDLAAAALATVWFNLWNSTMLGFNTAIDTFLAQAHGANEFKAYGMWAGSGLAIVMIVTVFVAGLLSLCGPAMKLFGQDEALAEAAGQFSYRLIPGLFPYYAFKVLVKYLQSQGIVMPGVWLGLCANGLNILFNWLLIYQLDMGLNGAPWATTITRFIEFVGIAGYIYWNRNTKKIQSTWPTISREVWNLKTLRPFCKLAFSGALSMSAEAWSFEIATILAGLLGTVELDAHIITLSIATFIFLSFPFAIGIAASIRVGQWIGEGSTDNARRSSQVSFVLATIVQLILIAILLPSKDWLGNVFSSNDEVADLVSTLIPLSCVFMMGDAVQATVGGVMRGLGRQRLVLYLNILAFWILAIPIGSLLTFVGNAGVAGLWWGYVVGIYAASCIGILVLRFRISWEEEAKNATKRLSTMSSMPLDSTTRRDEVVENATAAVEPGNSEESEEPERVSTEPPQ